MAKFKLTETIHSEKVRTVRLGDKTTPFGDAEQSKLVKLADDSRYVLTEVGDPIEGVVSSVNGATVDGYTIGGIVRYGRPDDYVFKRKAEIESLTPQQIKAAASTLDPDALTWVVVGDLKQIEAPIRALNLGEVTVVDADGKPVAAKQ